MRRAFRVIAIGMALTIPLSACKTKVTQIAVACRSNRQPTEQVLWLFSDKVDASVIKLVPAALDIALQYTGGSVREVPPLTTYFYRPGGAVLRVASVAQATMPPKGGFTYHVDPGGYARALTATGRGDADLLDFVIVVDGSYFVGVLSPPTCGKWPDRHLDITQATQVPDLKDKAPLSMAGSGWLRISPFPTEVMRTEGTETSTYAFFPAPNALTATKDETDVPDGTEKQLEQIGLTPAAPTFAITAVPSHGANAQPGTTKGG